MTGIPHSILTPPTAATAARVPVGKIPPHIRRCQDCEAALPPQGRGRPRLYCSRCSHRRKAERDAARYESERPKPPSREWHEEQAERLRQAHRAAMRRAQAFRRDQWEGGSVSPDPALRPEASGASTQEGR